MLGETDLGAELSRKTVLTYELRRVEVHSYLDESNPESKLKRSPAFRGVVNVRDKDGDPVVSNEDDWRLFLNPVSVWLDTRQTYFLNSVFPALLIPAVPPSTRSLLLLTFSKSSSKPQEFESLVSHGHECQKEKGDCRDTEEQWVPG